MEDLEKRMYFFVPYNISPIQQAIQAGHAALEYAHKFHDSPIFEDFIYNWKTWIILNGGTTNSNRGEDGAPLGTLDQTIESLMQNDIYCSIFHEPDLNDALTAICFICDERVFDYETYPEFDDWFCVQDFPDDTDEWKASYMKYDKGNRAEKFPSHYKIWVDNIMGGSDNVFLRELLKGKNLA